jgi:hypothetical protein
MKDQTIFLTPELRCPPFAWPQFGKRTPSGNRIVTYPPNVTKDLPAPTKRTKLKYVRKRKHDEDSDFETEYQAAKSNFQKTTEFQDAKNNFQKETPV